MVQEQVGALYCRGENSVLTGAEGPHLPSVDVNALVLRVNVRDECPLLVSHVLRLVSALLPRNSLTALLFKHQVESGNEVATLDGVHRAANGVAYQGGLL